MRVLQYIKNLFVNKTDKTKTGCPACKDTKVIATSAEHFNGDFSGPFVELETLKHGEFLQCESCHTMWYVDNTDYWVYTVSNNQLDSVHEWNNKTLEIKSEHLEILKDIGATHSDLYGNLKEFISIPCKCVLKSGQIIETAIISIQKKPPVGTMYDYNNEFHFIDEVETIEKSTLALPLDVRIATTEAGEVRMSYAPTLVISPNNHLYITNWITNFFYEDGINGEEITLPENENKLWDKATDTKNNINEIRIVVDWTPELESTFLNSVKKGV